MDVQYYISSNGAAPVTEWLKAIRDKKTKARIEFRLARIRLGHLGETRSVGAGVYEIKIDVGPGYRVYYAKAGREIVLLLCGGDKGSQDKDIRTAREYWEDQKARNKKVK